MKVRAQWFYHSQVYNKPFPSLRALRRWVGEQPDGFGVEVMREDSTSLMCTLRKEAGRVKESRV